jgi:hypothetical protein
LFADDFMVEAENVLAQESLRGRVHTGGLWQGLFHRLPLV